MFSVNRKCVSVGVLFFFNVLMMFCVFLLVMWFRVVSLVMLSL